MPTEQIETKVFHQSQKFRKISKFLQNYAEFGTGQLLAIPQTGHMDDDAISEAHIDYITDTEIVWHWTELT